MRPHFLATTEGSFPITALLFGFEFSDPLVLDAKNDWTLEGDVYPEFFQIFLDVMTLYFDGFPVFQGVFPSTFGMF